MIKVYSITALILLASVSAISQQRPRYYVNIETNESRTGYRSTAAENKGKNPGRRELHPPHAPSPGPYSSGNADRSNPSLVKKTARVTLTIHNSYTSPREIYPPSQGNARRSSTTSRNLEPPLSREIRSTEASLRTNVNSSKLTAVGSSMRGFSTGNVLVDSYIVDSSRRYNIDPLLIYAQMGQESSFKEKALSHKGARGLMQLMPMTAKRLGVRDIYDPKQNIEGGVKYMRILLDMFSGDMKLALAGYNAGEGAVMKYGYRIPPYRETQDYVRRITARYNRIKSSGH